MPARQFDTIRPAFFSSAADFRRWLEVHHGSAREILAGFEKAKSGRGITYPEALDTALSFGWIDGVRKRTGTNTYAIRFTPRKPGSVWSAANVRRAEKLISRGAMDPAGLDAFRRRDERKTRLRSHERANAQLDPALDVALRSNGPAASFFDAQPAGYKRLVAFWIMSAKKDTTRARRLARLIERSASQARIDLLHPNRS